MRQLFDDPRSRRGPGREVRPLISAARTHRRPRRESVDRRLESIRATGRARRAAAVTAPASASACEAAPPGPPRAVSAPDGGRTRSRSGATRARRCCASMRPFTAYQQTINAGIVAALDGAARWHRRRAQRVGAASARLIGELRTNDGTSRPRCRHAMPRKSSGCWHCRLIAGLYLAIAELRHRHALITRGTRRAILDARSLTGFELRAFSQNGEDGVLAEILRRTGAPSRCFVEFGVESGREGNCVYLADVAGWPGRSWSRDETYCRRSSASTQRETACGTVTRHESTPGNVERPIRGGRTSRTSPTSSRSTSTVRTTGSGRRSTSYRPRVVVIEYNSALEARRRLVQPHEPQQVWDGSEFFGASFGALRILGRTRATGWFTPS